MCLSVPGKVIELLAESDSLPMARIGFGDVEKNIVTAYTPEVKVGDYVLVHVGFSLKVINEYEANQILMDLDQIL